MAYTRVSFLLNYDRNGVISASLSRSLRDNRLRFKSRLPFGWQPEALRVRAVALRQAIARGKP